MAKVRLPEPKFEYDEKANVMYITFGLGEPSYLELVDDFLGVEFGLFSGQLTGFRVIAPSARTIRQVTVLMQTEILKAKKAGRLPKVGDLEPDTDLMQATSDRLKEFAGAGT